MSRAQLFLMIWVPLSVLLLVWTVNLSSGSDDYPKNLRHSAGNDNGKGSKVHHEQQQNGECECGHGFGVMRDGECIECRCQDGWTGPSCDEEVDEEHAQAEVVHGRTEAEQVLHDHPYLQYSQAGEEACRGANKQWEERIQKAYGGSKEEIGGLEGIHLFFTTDCSKHSLWQALSLENSWAKVRHPGAITRIVSGCYSHTGVPAKNTALMLRQVTDHPKAFIFFGPRVGGAQPRRAGVSCSASEPGWYDGKILKQVESGVDGVDDCKKLCREALKCASWNYRHSDKVCHLFEDRRTFHEASDHSTGTCSGGSPDTSKWQMPDYLADYSPINRPATAMYWVNYAKPLERVLGLLDPDMIFARPLLFHFSGEQTVEKGRPVGQYYDYLVSQDWDKHYTKICTEPSVCKPLGNKKDFAPGPPHFMHRQDWKDLAPWWLRYTVGARKYWRAWTSEMAGMSIGMARLGLRSRLEENGMWDRTPQATELLYKEGMAHGGTDVDRWKNCAFEGGFCTLPNTKDTFTVRYGAAADNLYLEKGTSGQTRILCAHSSNDLGAGFFQESADPAPGHQKNCFIRQDGVTKGVSMAGGATAGWQYCGNEGATCRIPLGETYTVRYGFDSLVDYAEKKGVQEGSEVPCTTEAFERDPAPGKVKQCYFKQETGKLPPPDVLQYLPVSKLPSLWHYCFTLEVNRAPWPESLWRTARPQRKWEEEHNRPLLDYMHWSKYRTLTDWPGNALAKTMLDCESPLLFHFPPLPAMLRNYSHTNEDRGWQVFFSAVMPAINEAVLQYKLKYCPDRSKINLKRVLRTGHDTYWFSKFQTFMDPSAPSGYVFERGD